MTTDDEYGIPVGAYSEPESLTAQAWRVARAFFLYRARPAACARYHELRRGGWRFRRQFTLVNALVLLWWAVLYWGERRVFDGAVGRCRWENWENWEPGANPHRLLFVADPQLIDPHTYPGRPWPLNPLTYKYTDLYLRRTYSRFQTLLYPDTVFFLGDLFDGGREWSTRTTKSPQQQYRKYGDDFWMNEYRRFGDVFFKHWADGGLEPRPGQPGKKLISSLPGNHDLGFARGVQVGVRNRFNAYFGDGNRIDVIANHTFVSIDSVSLSAFGQESPQEVQELWRPTKDFLETAKEQKKRRVQRELRVQQGLRPYPGWPHHQVNAEDLAAAELPHANNDVTDFPTILLTHVPLYRAPGTPCGPQREHWPPTPPPPGQPPLEYDDRNAIAVRGGYQYQNVLNREITADIAEKVGDIRYAFSGDDHDYCEVLHRGYASAGGGIREITVKSISWAMGVRHPGVVLMSMWNPVDEHGAPKSGDASKTVQTHLCLLPDQIGTFLTYATLFGVTLVLLVLRAALVTVGLISSASTSVVKEGPLLPTSTSTQSQTQQPCSTSSAEHEKATLSSHNDAHVQTSEPYYPHSTNSSTCSDRATLQIRSAQARTRCLSPSASASASPSAFPAPHAYNLRPPTPHQHPKYTYPLVQHAGYYPINGAATHHDEHSNSNSTSTSTSNRTPTIKIYGAKSENQPSTTITRKHRTGCSLFAYQVRVTLARVVVSALALYLFLLVRG